MKRMKKLNPAFLCFWEEFEDTKGGNQNPYIEEEDNTMAKRKRKKRTNNDLQNTLIKLKIEQHKPH